MKIVPRVFEFTKADLVAALQSHVRKETESDVVLDPATLEVHEEDRGSGLRVLLRETWSEPLVASDSKAVRQCQMFDSWNHTRCLLAEGHEGLHDDGSRGPRADGHHRRDWVC